MEYELCCDKCGKTVAFTDDIALVKLVNEKSFVCIECSNSSEEEGENE